MHKTFWIVTYKQILQIESHNNVNPVTSPA